MKAPNVKVGNTKVMCSRYDATIPRSHLSIPKWNMLKICWSKLNPKQMHKWCSGIWKCLRHCKMEMNLKQLVSCYLGNVIGQV